jgi:hypothetical protein
VIFADPSGRAVWSVGLRPLACWDNGFQSLGGPGCLCLVNVVYCQVQISALGWSPVQSSSTECDVTECDREASIVRRPWLTRGCCAMKKKSPILFYGFHTKFSSTINSCYSCKLYVSPIWLLWFDPKFLSQYFRFYLSVSFEKSSALCSYVYKSDL